MRDPFVETVRTTITVHRMMPRRGRVLVAVSGGPDSVALLAALVDLGVKVTAAHVNHRLRGSDSEADARFVRRLAGRLGVELLVLDGALAAGPNLEERARERRYTVLLEAARAGGFARLAMGHTRDDQAETVLLRLLRGAGGAGLSAIAPLRADGVVRPLLVSGRDEVLAFLRRRRLRFRVDRTNREMRFTRNRIRHRLLPLLEREFNPAVREALARAAELLRDDEVCLRGLALAAGRRVGAGEGLDVRRLLGLPVALARRVVRHWLEDRRGSLRAVDAGHVDDILRVAHAEARAVSVPGGEVRRSGSALRWRSAGRPAASPFRVALEPGRSVAIGEWRLTVRRVRRPSRGPTRWRALFDAEALGGLPIEARSVTPGVRIRPLGLGGSKKLQDVFVDARVPRDERAAWPIVTAGGGIVWIPGLVRAERAPVSRETHEVIVVEARRVTETGGVAAKNTMCYRRRRRSAARGGLPSGRRRRSRKEPI